MVYIRIVGRCPAMPKSETGPNSEVEGHSRRVRSNPVNVRPNRLVRFVPETDIVIAR
jgi:hypothetical protein